MGLDQALDPARDEFRGVFVQPEEPVGLLSDLQRDGLDIGGLGQQDDRQLLAELVQLVDDGSGQLTGEVNRSQSGLLALQELDSRYAGFAHDTDGVERDGVGIVRIEWLTDGSK